jgi:hypothetical protein
MPADPDTDPFRPPKVPTLVGCLHCQQVCESYLIGWRERPTVDGQAWGFWCCPVEGCGGAGFGCDILPIDPAWTDEDGERIWVEDDEEEEDYSGVIEDGPPSDKPSEAGGGEEIPY